MSNSKAHTFELLLDLEASMRARLRSAITDQATRQMEEDFKNPNLQNGIRRPATIFDPEMAEISALSNAYCQVVSTILLMEADVTLREEEREDFEGEE